MRTGAMRKILGFLMLLSASRIACAEECPPLMLTLYSDQGFQMRVLMDDNRTKIRNVQLYSGDKLLRTFVTDREGEFRSDPVPEGRYHLEVSNKWKLDLLVRPERSGLHGPFVIWHLFPKKWIAGKKVTGRRPCPVLVIKD